MMRTLCVVFLVLQTLTQTTIINYMDTGYVTQPVVDMGTCGASWVFAAVSLYQSAMMKWNSSLFNTSVHLSEQYVLVCSGQGDCNGGSLEQALIFLQNNGAPLSTNWVYNGTSTIYGLPDDPANCATHATAVVKLTASPLYLNKYTSMSFSTLQGLLKYNPVASLMAINSSFINYTGTPAIITCTTTVTTDSQTNFATVIVGYDTANNLIIQGTGNPIFGQAAGPTPTYTNATATGGGFGKISNTLNYCGLLRNVYQYSLQSNTNIPTSALIIGVMFPLLIASIMVIL